jgi:hypothetical protein
MPRLIHLNGPSRVGKSTLARRYADEHPRTLVLDLDVLAGLIGGWRDNLAGALEVARGLGRELAARHLRDGHDVVYPQLVTVYDSTPDPTLEETAAAAGASYVEVALLVDDREHLQRLRAKRPTSAVEEQIQTALADPSSNLVDTIRGHLAEHLANRPHAIRIDTTDLTEDQTYRRLRAALEGRQRCT